MTLRRVGRYVVGEAFATGGMSTVHLGRLEGPAGFSRTLAVKRMTDALSQSAELSAMFLDEARLAARVHHPNVVATLDVVRDEGLALVMDLVHGVTVARLLAGPASPISPGIAVAIAIGLLLGLHAAHEARGPDGALLELVHRDVSPSNVIVGSDGVCRVLDFGIAKAAHRLQRTTAAGHAKGKLRYLAPEQLRDQPGTPATDVHAAAAVLWECLTGASLFGARSYGETLSLVLRHRAVSPSELVPEVPRELSDVVLRGLAASPGDRPATALAMAEALERVVPMASQIAVSSWVRRVAADELAAMTDRVRGFEQGRE